MLFKQVLHRTLATTVGHLAPLGREHVTFNNRVTCEGASDDVSSSYAIAESDENCRIMKGTAERSGQYHYLFDDGNKTVASFKAMSRY